MPVILLPEDEAKWLDPATTDSATLSRLLKPYPAESMDGYCVSRAVKLAGERLARVHRAGRSAAYSAAKRPDRRPYFAAQTMISTWVPGVRSTPMAARAGRLSLSTHAIQASFISSLASMSAR